MDIQFRHRDDYPKSLFQVRQEFDNQHRIEDSRLEQVHIWRVHFYEHVL